MEDGVGHRFTRGWIGGASIGLFRKRNVAANGTAAAPLLADVEKLLLPVRTAVLIVIAVGIGSFAWDQHNNFILGLLLVGVVYNVAVFFIIRSGAALEKVGLISSLVHGTLTVLGLLATGGLRSSFHPLLTVLLAAIAMRFPFRWALSTGTSFILVFIVGDWLIIGTAGIGPRVIFASLNLIALWMVAALACRNAMQRAKFLQVAAHELRNPMAGVKGILSLLRARAATGRPADDITPMIEVMEREIDRLSALLNEIVEGFHIQDGRLMLKRERVNLIDVVTSALQPFLSSEGKHRFVFQGADHGVVSVEGDFNRLEEVVRNLLSNGVKYSPDGGEVRLTLRVRGQWAVVSVSDRGIGIPNDQLTRVFEGFYRATNLAGRDPGGMGLGLYICRDIVQRHGGRIWAESCEGRGTTFHVELPRYYGPSAS